MTVIIFTTILEMMSTVFFCISNFKKTKKEITFLHMAANICDFVMYLVLGAKTGLANAFANICKNMAYSKFDSKGFTIGFSVFRICLLILGYEGITTVLFVVLEIAGTIILISGTTQQFRIVTLLKQGVWVAYDFLFATIYIALVTTVGFISCLISVIKNCKNK